jgi:hypothetical protein
MMRDALSRDDPPLLAPGTEIRGYAIERQMASGGMGVVYLARDIALDRRVAIKALKPSIAGDAEHRRRLKHEAQLMAQLAGHPNIATVHALIDDGDALYIVEECLSGPTLREHLATGALPAPEAIEVGLAVLRALGAAHQQNIVHRDLKPENVMRTSTGTWKVLDFGIAKLQGPDPRTTLQTRVDQRLGTPLYMSPEQLRGEAVDGRSDLFAFGILLYELLTRRHPFTRRSDLAALSTWTAVLNEPPLPFEADEVHRLPAGLPDVIARCLEKDPGRRWSSAEDLEAALQNVRSGGPSPARLARPHEAVMWWQFHEAAAAVVYWLTLIPVWRVRPWIGRTELSLGGVTAALDARTLLPRADQHRGRAVGAPSELRVRVAQQAIADSRPPRPRDPLGEHGRPPLCGIARRGRRHHLGRPSGMGASPAVARARQLCDRLVHRTGDGARCARGTRAAPPAQDGRNPPGLKSRRHNTQVLPAPGSRLRPARVSSPPVLCYSLTSPAACSLQPGALRLRPPPTLV